MFDNYVGAKNTKTKAWTVYLVFAAVFLHAFGASALVVKSWWSIAEIERPTRSSAGISTAPPPPPPPAGGKSKKIEKKVTVKKVKEVTQVDERKEKPKVEDSSDEDSDVEGVEGGVEGGVVGGVVGGVIGGVEGGVLGGVLGGDPPPPPPPDEPKVVPQHAIEQQRVSGEKDIHPPNDVATLISRSGQKAVGVVKMCLNAGGSVKSLNMLKSTGHPSYDAKIKSQMQRWKYRPFLVNSKPVPICTSITFVYIPQ